MPEKEIRHLAAQTGGEKLMQTFMKEIAKLMQQRNNKQPSRSDQINNKKNHEHERQP